MNNKKSLVISISVYFLIILVCTGVYFQTIFYGYTQNDDDIIIGNNAAYLKNISNIPDAFVSDAWYRHKEIELYRPLQNISFILDARWGGDIIHVVHISNLLLHILCCISIFHLLILLGFRRKYAFAGAQVYAVHFLFLHTVIWGPARGDLLLSLFSILSFIFFILLLRQTNWYLYLLHLISFVLALFSKETALVLPVIFLIYILLFDKKEIWNRSNLFLLTSYFVLILIFYWLRDLSITGSREAVSIGSLFLNIRTLPEVVIKFFIPVNFSVMPSFNFPATISGILVMIGMTVFFVMKRKFFNKTILFSMLWFGLFLLPGIIYRPEFSSYHYEYLDHRDYLPCLGLLMIVLLPIQQLEISNRKTYLSRLIFSGFIIAMIYLISMNFYLHPSYKNPLTYSENAIDKNPRCALAYFIHGNEVYKSGNMYAALTDFTNAVKYYPKFYDARYNKAVLLFREKRFPEALDDLNRLLDSRPDYNNMSYFMRGVTEYNLHDADAAKRDFETVLKGDPGNQEARQYLLNIDRIIGNTSPALQTARKLNDEGVAEGKKGNYKDAMDLFLKALSQAPEFTEAMVNLGNCKHALGDPEGACREWKKAAALGSSSARQLVVKFCK